MQTHPDFKEPFALFNARGVEYLVVGAYALAFHGAPRFPRRSLCLFLVATFVEAHNLSQDNFCVFAPWR